MAATKTLILAAVALASSASADTVTLYDSPFFQGEAFTIGVNPDNCFNVGPYFNDRASSANWDLPHGHSAWIEFYEHNDCKGTMRQWSVDANGYPNNFAIDGIDNMVSSVRMTGDWCWSCYSPPYRSLTEDAAGNATAPNNATKSSVDGANL